MQARDVMTTEVLTVGPDTSAKHAGELMAEHGFAAWPVVADGDRVVGIVAGADVLRDRIPQDPRLHARQDGDTAHESVPLVVREVMTTAVRTVEPSADLADLARLLTEGHLRSVPVVAGGALVGIVSRRDVLRALVRPDDDICADALRLIEAYTGDLPRGRGARPGAPGDHRAGRRRGARAAPRAHPRAARRRPCLTGPRMHGGPTPRRRHRSGHRRTHQSRRLR